MSYESLQAILAQLETQQRREFATLSHTIAPAQIEHKRRVRKQLLTVAGFFIEQSWEALAPPLEAFSLEAEAKKSPEELKVYLNALRLQEPAYAWAWIRARMNARLMQRLEACVPDLLRQYPEMAMLYQKRLRQVDTYWFRESPLHHLKAGYHTALAVTCKWYGTAFELQNVPPASCPHAMPDFTAELRQFASCSMTMLTRTDGYLWDSAGASPMEAVLEEGKFKIRAQPIEDIALESAPDYGVRLGCPALRARREEGTAAFPGLIHWVEQVFVRYLLNT